MRVTVRPIVPCITVILIMLALAACTVRLLPAYDQATYQSLTSLNANTLTLFSSLSAGSSAKEFPRYEDQYNELIGGFSAARMTLANRPTPPIGQTLFGTGPLSAICGKNASVEDCLNATPRILDQIVALLTKMRDIHQQRGLPAEVVSGLNGRGGLKGQYQIEVAQVLTVEAALQR